MAPLILAHEISAYSQPSGAAMVLRLLRTRYSIATSMSSANLNLVGPQRSRMINDSDTKLLCLVGELDLACPDILPQA